MLLVSEIFTVLCESVSHFLKALPGILLKLEKYSAFLEAFRERWNRKV